MRMAGVVLGPGGADAVAAAAVQTSRTTHAPPAALEAAEFWARVCHHALHQPGASKEEIVRAGAAMPLTSADMQRLAGGSWADLPYPPARGEDGRLRPENSGYAVGSLETAIYCFMHSGSWTEGALLCANLGGDADTVACIYGQLAGAYYGHHSLPPAWLERLWARPLIEAMAECLWARTPAARARFEHCHKAYLAAEQAFRPFERCMQPGPRMYPPLLSSHRKNSSSSEAHNRLGLEEAFAFAFSLPNPRPADLVQVPHCCQL